jgi:hypothetical protein
VSRDDINVSIWDIKAESVPQRYIINVPIRDIKPVNVPQRDTNARDVDATSNVMKAQITQRGSGFPSSHARASSLWLHDHQSAGLEEELKFTASRIGPTPSVSRSQKQGFQYRPRPADNFRAPVCPLKKTDEGTMPGRDYCAM